MTGAEVELEVARLLIDVYTGVGVEIWLTSSNRNLGGTPRDLIAAGETDAVLREASRVGGLFR